MEMKNKSVQANTMSVLSELDKVTAMLEFAEVLSGVARNMALKAFNIVMESTLTDSEEPFLLMRASVDEAPVLMSFQDVEPEEVPDDLIFAEEENTGLIVAFDEFEAIMEDEPLIFGTIMVFRCNEAGNIQSITPEDYFRMRDILWDAREVFYNDQDDEEIEVFRLNLKGYAPEA